MALKIWIPTVTVKIEEEHMPAYEKGLYYPVQIGQISTLGIKYCPSSDMAQIPPSGSCCMKLSFLYPFRIQMGRAGEPRIHNTTSLWLTQFSDRRYAALKVYICKPGAERESKVLGHLAALKSSHPGKGKVRTMLDTFIADGPNGKRQC